MELHICKLCKRGAILIEDLKLPAEVSSVKVISGNRVLSLFATKLAANSQCPSCGMFITEAEPKKPAPEKKKTTPP